MATDQAAIAAQITASVATVSAVLSTVGSLQTGRPVVLKTVYDAVQDALAPWDAALASFDAAIDTGSVGGVVPALPAPQLATLLLAQASYVAQQGRVVIGRAFLARVGVNVKNAPG